MKMVPTKSNNKRNSSRYNSASTPSRCFSSYREGNAISDNDIQYGGVTKDEDSHSPVTVTSPLCFAMKAEYLILDITTEMVSTAKLRIDQFTYIHSKKTKYFMCKTCPFCMLYMVKISNTLHYHVKQIELAKMFGRYNVVPVVPSESNNEEGDLVNIEYLSSPVEAAFNALAKSSAFVNSNKQDDGGTKKAWNLSINTSLLQHNDEIKDKIYTGLVKIYEIAMETTSDLDQYILRELRYLQEFLTHGYPEIAQYIKVPLEEVIVSVKAKTKGFTSNAQDSFSIPLNTANGTKSPPLSPPAKKGKTDDRRGKDDKKLKTTEKVRQAAKTDEKNRNDTNMNIYKNNLNICTNRCIQEPYGFFIDVGNEGDEGLFFD